MTQAEQAFLHAPPALSPRLGRVPMISTVTAAEIQGPELAAAYWARNIRQPVRFAAAVQQALQLGGRLFLEIGPHPVLCAELARQITAAGQGIPDAAALPTLRRDRDDRTQLLTALGALHVRGVAVRWRADFPAASQGAQVVALPSYPWQRERFWISPPKPAVPVKPPGIASNYYDSLTRIVESAQAQRPPEHAQGLYLTFAPFAQVVPGFSWLQVFTRPQEHPDLVRLMHQQQLELREVLFRHVDFAECERVLDFGCGMSVDLLRLAKEYPHLSLDGYTISASQAEFGRSRLREQGLEQRVHVYCRDSARDPFPDRYDLVFGFEVAHHIKDKGALFANITSHLKSHGTLVLADFVSNASFEIEHEASSSFFLTADQWIDLLSAQQLLVQDVIDVSRPIANFLHDPHFDAHLRELRQQGGQDEDLLVSFQSYDRLGKMLDRGLASYILLSAKKVEEQSEEALRAANRAALTSLLPYAAPSALQAADNELLYGVEWRQAPRPAPAPTASAWLLVAQRPETTAPLAARLATRGIRCVRVHAGRSYAQLGPDEYQMDLGAPEAYRRLLQSAFGTDRPCERVVYLGAIELQPLESSTAEQVTESLTALCSGAVYLVQSLVLHGFRKVPRLCLVTRGAQAVAGSGALQAAQAALWGLGKAIALEHPELRCRRLDLDPAAAAEPGEPAALIDEVGASDREDQVVLRGAERYVARLVRAPLSQEQPPASGPVIRGDRSYLITGGTGGLGIELARWLVDRGAGAVVLASRSEPTPQLRSVLREMNQRGAHVLSVQADVSDPGQVARLLQQIRTGSVPLAGILHLAGVLKDQTLLDLSAANIRAVLEPKAVGAWLLHRQAPADLDFFVLYSSAAALCGSPGQAGYFQHQQITRFTPRQPEAQEAWIVGKFAERAAQQQHQPLPSENDE